MNLVSERCVKESSAKFHYASKKMFSEIKLLKIFLYILAIIPIVLQLIPSVSSNETLSTCYTLISFGLTLINEVLSSFINNHKEKAILEYQLYESEITGSTFSKIEYDRESTNELNELAIRKGLPSMRRAKSFPIIKVDSGISDDYSYLYLCRLNAAKTNFILGRVFVFYAIILSLIIFLFAGCVFLPYNTQNYLKLIIGFYPLVIPFIRASLSCKKCQKNCVKICADIDNFFADGDASLERLARFYYYVQNIEFEMMVNRPTLFNIFPIMFKRGTTVLTDGVTYRFIDAINELKAKHAGFIQNPKGHQLITKKEYDYELLDKKIQKSEQKKSKASEKPKAKTVVSPKPKTTKTTKSKTQSESKVSTSKTKKTTKKSTK